MMVSWPVHAQLGQWGWFLESCTCCAFQLREVVLFVLCSKSNNYLFCIFSLPFPPLLVDLVSIGLVSIFTDLVSVTVSGGWLPLAELPWIPMCRAQGIVAQGSLLALESPPTLAGTIPKLIYWRWISQSYNERVIIWFALHCTCNITPASRLTVQILREFSTALIITNL